jgi:hypothetical protein
LDKPKQEEIKLSCFKKVSKRAATDDYWLFPGISTQMRTTYFLDQASGTIESALMDSTGDFNNWKSTFPANRYFRSFTKPGYNYYPDQGVIIYQFLLWSHLCKDTHEMLTIFFSSIQPDREQYTVGNVDDAVRETTNVFQNINDSVAACYAIWKSGFFIKVNKKKQVQNKVQNEGQHKVQNKVQHKVQNKVKTLSRRRLK